MAKTKIFVLEIGDLADIARQLCLEKAGKGIVLKHADGSDITETVSPSKVELKLNLSQVHITVESESYPDVVTPELVPVREFVVVGE